MKLTAFLLIVTFLQVSAASFGQKLTYVHKSASLEQIIKEIRLQTGYNVIVSTENSKTIPQVDVNFKNTPLKDVLDKLLKDQPLTYEIKDKLIIIKEKETPLPGQIKAALAIPITISGKVTDTLGTPLIGATIANKKSNKAVITNDNGEFALTADPGDELSISFIGYKPVSIAIVPNMPYLNIALHPNISGLKEVVVSTGYQTLPAERATGSFAKVDNALFNKEVSTDVISRLEGNVPGLIFNKNVGAKNPSGYDISIRGHNTLFSNDQPLIVVDNFAYDGDLANLNPNDVESITVLKDAAAASIWGVRSGNGVIVITTKKGKLNQKTSVEFNANLTVAQKLNLYYNNNFLDANDYINAEQKLFNSGYYDTSLSNEDQYGFLVTPAVEIMAKQRAGSISAAQATNQLNALRKIDVRNDLSKYFYRQAVNQQYGLNLRGGSNTSDYYVSFGYDNNLAGAIGNKDNRVTINTNYNYYPIKNLQISLGLNYLQTTATSNAAELPSLYPYAKLVDSKGSPLAISTDLSPTYKARMTSMGLLDWQYKPLAEIGLADNINKAIDNRINVGLKYTFIKGLSAELKYQYEKSSTIATKNYSDSTYYARNLINTFTQINSDGSLTHPVPIGGILMNAYSDLISNQGRAQLNYEQLIGKDHHVNAILGTEIRQSISSGNDAAYYGYDQNTGNSIPAIDYSTYYPTLPYSYSSQIPNGAQVYGTATNNFLSYYFNGAYNYKNIYTFSVSGRIDHSNLFGVNTNQKAVPIYSFGFSWNLGDESFYHIDWLPYLKPRMTYGYTANINTNAAAITTIRQSLNSTDSGLPFAQISNPGNPELQWEKNRTINLGLDFATKNNRVSGNLEYYTQKGINLFGYSPLPPTTGLTQFFGNTAGTAGRGFDFEINSRNIVGNDFKWLTTFMLSFVSDKVTKYDVKYTVSQFIQNNNPAGTITPKAGADEFAIYAYRFAGLTHDTGDPQGIVNGKPSTDYNAILANNSLDSMNYVGSARPKSFGSLRNTISYKQFSVSFNIIGKFGYYFRKYAASDVSAIAAASGFVFSGFTNAWQKPGDENHTNIPSIQYPPFDNNRAVFYAYSSALVDKGDHIRLQDISLSYDIDRNSIHSLPFNHLTLYGYISNLGILWRANKDHLDPDLANGDGYPSPRTVAFGIKANF